MISRLLVHGINVMQGGFYSKCVSVKGLIGLMSQWRDIRRIVPSEEYSRCQLAYIVQYNVILFITHATVHINDFRGVRARYVKRSG